MLPNYETKMIYQETFDDWTSSLSNLQDALLNISICLKKHYYEKVIILIEKII